MRAPKIEILFAISKNVPEIITGDIPFDLFLRQVGNCPSGTLVAPDNTTGKFVEPELPIAISQVEDLQKQCSAPLWLHGRIPDVTADSEEYEVRNRIKLCRSGQSKNTRFRSSAYTETDK